MIEALQLYAKFLSELPTTPTEKDLKLHFFLGTDGNLLFVLSALEESPITNRYGGSMHNRVQHWFTQRGIVLEGTALNSRAYTYENIQNSKILPKNGATWVFSILIPVDDDKTIGRHYVYF